MDPPTVVLVHGVRASRAMWLRQRQALAAAGIPAVAIDLPAHGTLSGEAFSVPAATAAIEDAVSSIGGPVVVVGLSLGGYLALHWAARTRQPVLGVLAASCSTRTDGWLQGLYHLGARLIGALPDGGRGLSGAVARRTVPAHARADLAVDGLSVRGMARIVGQLRQLDIMSDIAAITVPVWLVNGRRDHFRWHERRCLAACRDGRLVVVPAASHLVSLTNPTAFNEHLFELVATVGGTGDDRPPDGRVDDVSRRQ